MNGNFTSINKKDDTYYADFPGAHADRSACACNTHADRRTRTGRLDFRDMIGRGITKYIKAIQAGMDSNYKPMEKVFAAVIRKTLRVHGER